MFTREELNLIEESLRFGLQNVEKYNGYPSKEFKTERIKRIKALLVKVGLDTNKRLL